MIMNSRTGVEQKSMYNIKWGSILVIYHQNPVGCGNQKMYNVVLQKKREVKISHTREVVSRIDVDDGIIMIWSRDDAALSL